MTTAKLTKADMWGVELWGPAVAALWKSIKDGQGKTMKSYEFNELPDIIQFVPCALSFLFPKTNDLSYNQSDLNSAAWHGQTEFHLTLDINKKSLGYVEQYYRLIAKAAVVSYTLNGLVEGFQIRPIKSMQPSILKYGDETEHYGIIVYWDLFESLSGKLTLGI